MNSQLCYIFQIKSETNCPMNVVSNAQISLKSLFFRLDQPMSMCVRKCKSRFSIGTGASNSRCSDTVTLSISNCLFFRRRDYSTLLCVEVSPIHTYRSEPSLYFNSLWHKRLLSKTFPIPNILTAVYTVYCIFIKHKHKHRKMCE